MLQKTRKMFDRLEDRVRGGLSRYPIVYAFLGGSGVIIFWRGIWHTVDLLMYTFSSFGGSSSSDLQMLLWWDGPLSILIGGSILLVTGVLVPSFIGSELIISGIKKEKKLAEKTEEELMGESAVIEEIRADVKALKRTLSRMERGK